jgi:chorismate synthase
MASNSFGKFFKITTFGESHGKAIGVIIDGCIPNLPLSKKEIEKELEKRSPGKNFFSSSRKEEDKIEILSGIFKGKTTGAPIAILIENKDKDSASYEKIKDLYRPSHANFTYLQKYGIFDYRGGGRASARETVLRVAAGAIAKKILKKYNIELLAFIHSIGDIEIENKILDLEFKKLFNLTKKSPLFCPDKTSQNKMLSLLKKIKEEKDSIGGSIRLISTPLIPGLGDPIYEKLSSELAKAFLSIPGCIGLEVGRGFMASRSRGSENNDRFELKNNKVITKTNNSGGILAGISTGMPLDIKIAFKPTSTIEKPQETLNFKNEQKILKIDNFRHDICIAIRACPVVEAMAAIVLLNALMSQKTLKI